MQLLNTRLRPKDDSIDVVVAYAICRTGCISMQALADAISSKKFLAPQNPGFHLTFL